MSLETAKLGFNRMHDGEMLCCTTERAEYITKAFNVYKANQKRIAELEVVIKTIHEDLKDMRIIERETVIQDIIIMTGQLLKEE